MNVPNVLHADDVAQDHQQEDADRHRQQQPVDLLRLQAAGRTPRIRRSLLCSLRLLADRRSAANRRRPAVRRFRSVTTRPPVTGRQGDSCAAPPRQMRRLALANFVGLSGSNGPPRIVVVDLDPLRTSLALPAVRVTRCDPVHDPRRPSPAAAMILTPTSCACRGRLAASSCPRARRGAASLSRAKKQTREGFRVGRTASSILPITWRAAAFLDFGEPRWPGSLAVGAFGDRVPGLRPVEDRAVIQHLRDPMPLVW